MRQHPRRPLHLTEDLVARVERFEPDSGPEAGLTPLSDEDRENTARDLLAQLAGQPFWVFAYGSLIWKPAFDHVEARPVRVYGWRRCFSLDIVRWRATVEQPGLMLALARGGACNGVAYRLDRHDAFQQMMRLLEREVSYHQDIPSVRWVTCRTADASFRALTFYAAPRSDPFYIYLPLAEQARRLARAAEHAGSCAAYLRNTVEHLEQLGIRDRYLWDMQRRVAAEISMMPTLARPT